MPSGDVSAFMRDDPDHLVRCRGAHDQPGMNEHIVAVDDEGVEGTVVDDVDLDALGAEACGIENRFGIVPQQRFGFRVADNSGRIGRAGIDQTQRQAGQSGQAKSSPERACLRARRKHGWPRL